MSEPVRPATHEPVAPPDRSFPRWLVPLGAVAVLGMVLWIAGLATGGDPEVTTTLDPEALATTSTAAPTTTMPDLPVPGTRAGLHRRLTSAQVVVPADIEGNLRIPGLEGLLVTVTGSPGQELRANVTPVGSTVADYRQVALPPFARDLGVESGGRTLALLGGGEVASSDLWLIPLADGEIEVVPEIRGYTWSLDRSGHIGWLEQNEDFEFHRATVDQNGVVADFLIGGVEPGAHLAGLTSTGMWRVLVDGSEGFVAETDRDFREVARRPADLAIVAEAPRLALLAHLEIGDWSWRFGLLEFGRFTPLPWAPPDALGRRGLAAWARDGDPLLAFVGPGGAGGGWLEVWDAEGRSVDAIQTRYRIDGVSFSHDNRFMVMPAEDGETGASVVLLYDIVGSSLTAIVMDDPVLLAEVVAPPGSGATVAPDPGASTN